jgi:hypothetical protein
MDSGDKVEMAVALDELLEAREQAIKRAAFEAGRDAAHDAAHDAIHKAVAEMVECNRLKNEVCAAIALVSPPAQETG